MLVGNYSLRIIVCREVDEDHLMKDKRCICTVSELTEEMMYNSQFCFIVLEFSTFPQVLMHIISCDGAVYYFHSADVSVILKLAIYKP